MTVTINGTTGITTPSISSDAGITADGISFADGTPANTLVTTTGGNVGIGTSSPTSGYRLTLTGGTGLNIQNTGASDNVIVKYSNSSKNWYAGLRGDTSNVWALADDSAFRLIAYTNGNIGINNNLDFVGGGATVRIHLAGGTATSLNSGIAAAWNVHSDYRLKENFAPINNAIASVLSLKPCMFTWIGEDGNPPTAGFLAHELAEQAPYAVFGEKDATNEDGSIKAQAADYGKITPLLVKAIQEQQALITQLQADVAALKGQA